MLYHQLVDNGALPVLVQMMEYTDEEEQYVAARTVWTLSFDAGVKQRIVEEPGCVVALEKLSISSDSRVRKAAQGCLWKIREDDNKRAASAVGE